MFIHPSCAFRIVVHHLYGDLTYRLLSKHGPISIGMSSSGKHSNEDNFLNYVHVIRLFYVLNIGMPTLSNYDQKRIYHDVMYCNIDAGDHSASFLGSS